MAAYAKLLGRAALQYRDEWHEPAAGKTSALLYYLAYQASWVTRDRLTYLFWPNSSEEKARQNLRRLLTSIRTLPYTEALESEFTRIRWPVDTDVHAFKQAVEAGQLTTALALYNGPLLQNFVLPEAPEFEEWLELERQVLHQMWREVGFTMATEFEASKRYSEASEVLAKLYKADLLDEEVLRHYLQVLYAGGHQSKALDVFDKFAKRLKDELEGEPESTTLEVMERIRQEKSLAFLALEDTGVRAPVAKHHVRHNLPA